MGSAPETTDLSILQQLNMALAIGVIVAVGDAVQNILIENPPADEIILLNRLFLLAFIMLWAAKVFVDDHYMLKSEESKNTPSADFLFCLASYTFLISAAALISDERFATIALALHFAVLVLWLVTGFVRGVPDPSRRKKLVWLMVDIGCVIVLVLLLVLSPPDEVRTGAIVLLFGFAMIDVWNSRTFTSQRLRRS